MKHTNRWILTLLICIAVHVQLGCDGDPVVDPNAASTAPDDAAAPTNRVSIPAAVRSNLGITFVTVEIRRIEQTLRVPGRFEYQPTARQEYRTMLPGRVELLVEQFAQVQPGDVLYRIESPGWRELQQRIAENESLISRLQVRQSTFEPLMNAHEVHEESLVESVSLWTERLNQLDQVREAGGGRSSQLTEARAARAQARSDLAEVREKAAQLVADRSAVGADLVAAESQRTLLLETAGVLLDMSPTELTRTDDTQDGSMPRWRSIRHVDVYADTAGVVESLGLTNGAWADEKTAVLSVVQPERLRFHASGLQSDMGVLRDGLEARIVPPTPTTGGRATHLQDTMDGTLTLGLAGDPDERTIDLYVIPQELSGWARPGVSAQLEIITDSTAQPQLAIPLAAVQRDGLAPIIFRRTPENPNEAIRMEADLGMDDGRWVVVASGLRRDDEIVLDGAFQLMLATSGSVQQGGHFHADGTFHQGED